MDMTSNSKTCSSNTVKCGKSSKGDIPVILVDFVVQRSDGLKAHSMSIFICYQERAPSYIALALTASHSSQEGS